MWRTTKTAPGSRPHRRRWLFDFHHNNNNLASTHALVHNHPSGDPTPSAADIEMTRQIVEAGRALRIAVHDHLVVGRDGVASFRALGLF